MTQQWKPMPPVLTEKMHGAAVRTIINCTGNDDWPPAVYAAFLKHAPTPPASAQDDAKDERQAFEAWAKERGYQSDELARCKLGIVSPEYFNLNTENAWKAWQAARASVAAPAAGDARMLAALKQAHMALIGFMPQHRNAVIVNAIVAAREAIDAAMAASQQQEG